MQRFVFIHNHKIVATTFSEIGLNVVLPTVPYEFYIFDPLVVFQDGDTYLPEMLESKYSNVIVTFGKSSINSVYSPVCNFNRSVFPLAELDININFEIPSPYVYCTFDSPEVFNHIQLYGVRHGIKVPDYSLCDKYNLNKKSQTVGFSVLKTLKITNRSDIETFDSDLVILKPCISCNSMALKHDLALVLYSIYKKVELLKKLDELTAFDDAGNFKYLNVIIQQVADGNGDNFSAMILSGIINGQGKIHHFSPLILDTQFNEQTRNVKSTWSAENNSDESKQLQQKTELLISGNTNCFYQLQFLKNNGSWTPHDFQYRMTYYVDEGLERTGNQQYKADILRFVFDRTFSVPEISLSFALNAACPRNNKSLAKKYFAVGETRAIAIANLEKKCI